MMHDDNHLVHTLTYRLVRFISSNLRDLRLHLYCFGHGQDAVTFYTLLPGAVKLGSYSKEEILTRTELGLTWNMQYLAVLGLA